MNLNTAVVTNLLDADLLAKIGDPDENYPNVATLAKASKSIASRKWENICLEEINNVTGFLAVNNPKEYNSYWNQLVKEIKSSMIPQIKVRLDFLQKSGIITGSVDKAVTFDMINIVMASSYNAYTRSEFYEEMYEIYISGHLPCGWKGKYPNGQIEIY